MSAVIPPISDQQLFRALAREKYWFFLEYVHRGLYRHARHTRFIAERLQRIADGEPARLMIFSPPRHSKSMTVSESFPAYFLGRGPDRRVILVSYGDALAQRFGRANRQKLQEFGEELFGVTLSRDNSSVTNWSLAGHRGGMVSAGIGGPITGEGADLLIIDDPIKNQQEALSQTYREMLWREWQSTLVTRLSSQASVILIQTRWHEDDLAGRLIKYYAGDWEILNFTCEAEDGDILGRSVGEPLWPEAGFDKAWVAQTKRAVGSYVWAALYQQRPAPPEGGILKRHWWQFYRQPPSRFDEIIQSWDLTFKDSDTSDYVVGQVWGRLGANKYLLDQVRDRMDFVTAVQAIKTLSAKWPWAYTKLIEDRANGPAVMTVLHREVPGLIPVEPQGSKEARVYAISPQIEAGNVYLPDPSIAPWVHDFIEECTAFPNGVHDDQVDAMSQALIRFGAYVNNSDAIAILRRLKVHG